MEHSQCVAIEVKLSIKIQKTKEVYEWIRARVQQNHSNNDKIQSIGVTVSEGVVDGILALVFDLYQFVVGES